MSTRGYSQNLTFVNNPKKPLKDILKEDYQKALKNNFIFLSNPAPFNVQSYLKQKDLELATSYSSRYKLSSKKFFY